MWRAAVTAARPGPDDPRAHARQLREERKRNDHLAAELEQARKAAHAAEIALARCEAKLDLKEEEVAKLEAKLEKKQ